MAERFARWGGGNVAVEYAHGDLIGSSVVRTTSAGAISEPERILSFG